MAKNNYTLIHGVSVYINPSTDMPVCVTEPGQQMAMGWACWVLNPVEEKTLSVLQTHPNQPGVHKPSCSMVSGALYRGHSG
jgi:hypothetical protein